MSFASAFFDELEKTAKKDPSAIQKYLRREARSPIQSNLNKAELLSLPGAFFSGSSMASAAQLRVGFAKKYGPHWRAKSKNDSGSLTSRHPFLSYPVLNVPLLAPYMVARAKLSLKGQKKKRISPNTVKSALNVIDDVTLSKWYRSSRRYLQDRFGKKKRK